MSKRWETRDSEDAARALIVPDRIDARTKTATVPTPGSSPQAARIQYRASIVPKLLK